MPEISAKRTLSSDKAVRHNVICTTYFPKYAGYVDISNYSLAKRRETRYNTLMPLVPDFRLRRVLPHPKQGHSIASAVTCRRFSVFTTDELFDLFFAEFDGNEKSYDKPKMSLRGKIGRKDNFGRIVRRGAGGTAPHRK